MATRRALITGISGQDGSYLAEYLLGKGYDVHGIVRRVALEDPEHRLYRLNGIRAELVLHPASLDSYPSLETVVMAVQPDECYHLAAQSFVNHSLDDECETLNTNILGTQILLAVLRQAAPLCRFYFAGSSEMFGAAQGAPQNEETRFNPRSAYGISKVAGFQLTKQYRDSHGMFCCGGILFNHESPRRGYEFVTRKITAGIARILAGKTVELRLGNLDAQRDWGHAVEYVDAMWRMLQQPFPDDYVIATGETHTVREFVDLAFQYAGCDPASHLVIDPVLMRPPEPFVLCGDYGKARMHLGWKPLITFNQLVHEMVAADCRGFGIELLVPRDSSSNRGFTRGPGAEMSMADAAVIGV